MENKKRLILTGCGGSIAAHFLAHIFTNTNWNIVGIDSFRHKGWTDRIKVMIDGHPEWKERLTVITHDLIAPISPIMREKIGHIDYIINMASLSDVEASIQNPVPFIKNNVDLVLTMLEYAREIKPSVFIQISCYDEKTRAVTKRGLKYYWELKEGDEVLTLNPKKQTEFQPIQKVLIQNYEGNMVAMKGNTDVLVSPNHRMYDENMNIVEASEIKDRFVFPLALGTESTNVDTLEINGLGSIKADELLYLIGIFIGDGFTAYQKKIQENKSGLERKDFVKRKNSKGQFISGRTGDKQTTTLNSYRIFFDVPEKDKARKCLEKTLTNLGFSWTAQKAKSGEHVYLTNEHLMRFFDEKVGKGAANKRIPDFVWKLGKRNLKALYDGLIDSDGYYGKLHENYTTISNGLMSDIVLLSYLLGYKASNYYKYSECSYEGRTIKGGANQVLISRTNPVSTKQITHVPYKGKIWCITVKNKNFLVERNGKFYFSGNTDEVYGASASKYGDLRKEWDSIIPSNPYAASKAAQEAIATSYWRTYGVPVIITNTMNNFGEMQQSSKYPAMIQKWIAAGKKITIHGREGHIGSRSYIHSRNFADAIVFILKNCPPHMHIPNSADRPDRYNIAGDKQLDNLELAQIISKLMGKETLDYELVDTHTQRPGHDPHYGLDSTKLYSLGWKPPLSFEESMANCIKWQEEHPEWMRN